MSLVRIIDLPISPVIGNTDYTPFAQNTAEGLTYKVTLTSLNDAILNNITWLTYTSRTNVEEVKNILSITALSGMLVDTNTKVGILSAGVGNINTNIVVLSTSLSSLSSSLVVTGSNNIIAAKTITGSVSGNSRGIGAVDLQQSRVASTQVASGIYSVVGGGQSNIASGYVSTVGGGRYNIASGNQSTVGGGSSNTASGYAPTVGGGQSNTASGNISTVGGGGGNTASVGSATVGGGSGNTASGYASTIGGGHSNTTSGYYSTVGGGRYNNASGNYSTVGGGYSNGASNDSSTVGGGRYNDASGYYSTVDGGQSNLASANYSTVGGGINNIASGNQSTVGGGGDNTASGLASSVVGGVTVLADRRGMVASSAGSFTDQGDAQWGVCILRNTTTNNIQTELFLDGSAERFFLRNNETIGFEAQIVARRTGTATEDAFYTAKGLIKRGANAASTTIVGTVLLDVVYRPNTNWDVLFDADTTNGGLRIRVTGEAGKTIRWTATIRFTEVGGA